MKFDPENDRTAEFTDELPLWSAPFGIDILTFAGLRPDMKVLDVACGTGFPAVEIAERLGKNGTVYALDPWPAACRRIELKTAYKGLDNIRITCQKAERMPFEAETFDLIVSNNGINNVENPDKVLAECYRCAKPGAQLLLTMNLPETFFHFYSLFRFLLVERNMVEESAKLEKHIFDKRKPLDYTKKQIEKSGFRIKCVFVKSFDMRFADGTAFLNHFMIKNYFATAWEEVVPCEKRDEFFSEIERRLNSYAEEEGEIVMNVPYALFDCAK